MGAFSLLGTILGRGVSVMKDTELSMIQWKKAQFMILRPSFLKGGKKFGVAKNKERNETDKKGLDYGQVHLRKLPEETMIEMPLNIAEYFSWGWTRLTFGQWTWWAYISMVGLLGIFVHCLK